MPASGSNLSLKAMWVMPNHPAHELCWLSTCLAVWFRVDGTSQIQARNFPKYYKVGDYLLLLYFHAVKPEIAFIQQIIQCFC